ncbi:diguanylate cyclase [Glaciecola siphonariae]|uniref:Diguanylate cyclase n=1 Tax=Glaciecola siphonariae TaxID=521012 RepID=A0ABV9LZR5_9ALTE
MTLFFNKSQSVLKRLSTACLCVLVFACFDASSSDALNSSIPSTAPSEAASPEASSSDSPNLDVLISNFYLFADSSADLSSARAEQAAKIDKCAIQSFSEVGPRIDNSHGVDKNQNRASMRELNKGQAITLTLPRGINKISVQCSLNQPSVISFDRNELLSIEYRNADIKRLAATSPSYLLPVGTFSVDFVLNTHALESKKIDWQSLDAFLYKSLVSNITMAAFYGLCVVLMLYVFFMGRILGDRSFQLYSLYVFCAATFFLLQEGQLHIFLPDQSFLLSHQMYVLFAGLTVMAATVFISKITDIDTTFPKFSYFGLIPAAFVVLLIAIYMLFAEHSPLASFLGRFMALLTLAIMVAVLLLVMIQTYRRVPMAWLVCLSLLSMVAAMAYRVVIAHGGEFLEQYGLIIAFALEAFVFAIVVSSRIQRIKIDKQQAESDANTDSLCNVLNRRGWIAQAGMLLDAQANKGGLLSLLYIDLDDFKQINDSYGHECGDRVLDIVAKILKNQSRDVDVVGRVGGDEFVIAGHFDNQHECEGIATRLRERLHQLDLQINEDLSINISASIGHVVFDEPAKDVKHMLNLADQSMYQLKKKSRTNEFAGAFN